VDGRTDVQTDMLAGKQRDRRRGTMRVVCT